MSLKYVQTNNFFQAGGGNSIGATSLVLTSFTDIYGNVLTMTDFGTKGYGTCEPDTSNEEAFTFTGVTPNANGTYTLTGVYTALAKSPYTETSSLVRQHAGGTKVVVTDNVAFWNTFPNKNNDETVTGQWTFNNTPIVPGTVSDASTTVKGVSQISVAPDVAATPIAVGTNDPHIPIGYAVDASGADAYAITPSPTVAAYAIGQEFTFKAGTANTGACSLNVSGLGAVPIKKSVSTDLVTGDIRLNQIVVCKYDGTVMQMTSIPANVVNSYTSKFSNGSFNITNGNNTQTVAHNLGITPSRISFYIPSAAGSNSANAMILMKGVFDSSGQRCILYQNGNGGIGSVSIDTTHALATVAGNPTTDNQVGTVSVDATNITIIWNKSGAGGSGIVLFEAQY